MWCLWYQFSKQSHFLNHQNAMMFDKNSALLVFQKDVWLTIQSHILHFDYNFDFWLHYVLINTMLVLHCLRLISNQCLLHLEILWKCQKPHIFFLAIFCTYNMYRYVFFRCSMKLILVSVCSHFLYFFSAIVFQQ